VHADGWGGAGSGGGGGGRRASAGMQHRASVERRRLNTDAFKAWLVKQRVPEAGSWLRCICQGPPRARAAVTPWRDVLLLFLFRQSANASVVAHVITVRACRFRRPSRHHGTSVQRVEACLFLVMCILISSVD